MFGGGFSGGGFGWDKGGKKGGGEEGGEGERGREKGVSRYQSSVVAKTRCLEEVEISFKAREAKSMDLATVSYTPKKLPLVISLRAWSCSSSLLR